MADTAIGPGPGADGVAALKYAAQADNFQDDPNFYCWLEEWIGKQEEEAVMIDAFNTLNDYGMQFEFQQQQQQQKDEDGSAGAWPMEVGAPDQATSNAAQSQAEPMSTNDELRRAGSQQQHEAHAQHWGRGPAPLPQGENPSSSASLASQPSSIPSDDSSSLTAADSPSDSLYGQSTPQVGALTKAPASIVGGSKTGAGPDRSPRSTAPWNSSGQSLRAPASGGAPAARPFFGLSHGLLTAQPAAAGALPFGAAAPAVGAMRAAAQSSNPFDDGSFTLPMGQGLETTAAGGLLSDLQSFLRSGKNASSTGSSLIASQPQGTAATPSEPRVPSHGTVSSYVGDPPPAPPAPRAPEPALPPAGVARSLGSSMLGAGGMGVPSLEQLIVRVMCGNGSGSQLSRAVGGAAGLMGVSSLLGAGKTSATAAGPYAAGAMTLGSGGAGADAGTLGRGAGGLSLLAAPNYARNSTGSTGEDTMGCGDSDHVSASASREDFGCTEAMFGAAGLGGGLVGRGGSGSGHRYRRKSSGMGLSSVSQASTHHHRHHHHGIPVSHAHGHGHVGKVAIAGPAGAGGGGAGAGSRMTRSARAKAVFAALEAEVAGKMGELESLQRENATLMQRVEILEVAVERQNVVLNMLNAAKVATQGLDGPGPGVAGSFTSAPAVPHASARGQQHRLSAGAACVLSGEAATMVNAVNAALAADSTSSGSAPAVSLFSDGSGAGPGSEPVSRAGSYAGPASNALGSGAHLGIGMGMGMGSQPAAAHRLSPGEVLSAGPGSQAGADLLEWARKCTPESYMAWYKEHLQSLSLALLALEDRSPNPEAETRLVQLVAACWVRTTLTSVFQPLTMLRLKGLNLETNVYGEPPEQHWMDVIKFMTVSPQQVEDMENLFHSYNLLHGSFRAELQDTQRDLAELVERQDSRPVSSTKICSDEGLSFALQQTALLKRVRSILQKTHLLYSCTIGVAAMRILKPKEFAKSCVQSYPYYPCGPSLMKACAQLRAMKAIWGVGGC